MKTKIAILAVLFLGGLSMAQADGDLLSTAPESAIFPSQPTAEISGLRAGSVRFNRDEIDKLLNSQIRQHFELPSLENFTRSEPGSLEFQRFDLFAKGSRVRVFSAKGTVEIPRDPRFFFIATNENMGIGLALNLASGETNGFAVSYGQKMKITGKLDSELTFAPFEPEEQGSASCATMLDDQPHETLQKLNEPMPLSSSASRAGELISYQAVVAIDTDNEWMAGKGNDTTVAQQWISDMFLAMNVFYERDIETHLLVGDTFLRIGGGDPYTITGGSRLAQLDEFGEEWMDNMGGVDRQFAAMLSGRDVGSWSFSGIAWIYAYCDTGHPANVNGQVMTAGSYSYNAIGPSFGAGSVALYVGHELGHNMGSSHTHCYNPPVDQCYNGESSCYSGTPSCPASGQGTVMSYCHVDSQNGAGCGTNSQQFHPTVQQLLESRLSSQLTQGCIMPYTVPNVLLSSGFE